MHSGTGMFLVCSLCDGAAMMVNRLSEYPWMIVRLGCRYCNRRGQYRLARLAAKFGPEIGLDELLDKLAFDCSWRRDPTERRPGKYDPKCGAMFIDRNAP